MTTVRQIERFWKERRYQQLTQSVLAGRADVDPAVRQRLNTSTAAAALAVIRLDELGQSSHPFVGNLIRALIAAQQSDGGWGDLAVSALALRALRCCHGRGEAIDRGIQFLSACQKTIGAWPAEPLRRLPADAALTAFILLHLAGDADLARTARVDDALEWLKQDRDEIADETRPWIDRAVSRWQRATVAAGPAAPLFAHVSWS